jgi:predicted AlkP superfamily pyrophosphatase or phosphodiesterase
MRSFFLPIFIFTVLFSNNTFSQANKDINNGLARPKLVVGIVVDQMRWDYLYRYYNRYSEGGFKRLIKNGFSFENTMIPYTPTVTAAGHACIYTGSVPAINGIVGNSWIERQTGKSMYCTDDKTVQTVGSKSDDGEMSPKNMFSNTIGDELRFASNFKSRVFGVALKDRGAILPAGHSANAAYWFDDATGNWITSTYYMNVLPAWVDGFNAERRPDAYIKTGWNLLYDISKYDQSMADENTFEKTIPGEKTVTFPHSFTSKEGKDYQSIRFSPFGNSFTLDFAKQMIVKEKLGATGQTDMLCVSLSSTDYIGHVFGPQSLEIEDTYLRLDKELELFFNNLDKTFTDKDYVVFLSADHGAPYTPDYMKSIKQSAGTLTEASVKKTLNSLLEEKYKVKNVIGNIIEYQIFLNNKLMDSIQLNQNEVEAFIIKNLLKMPEISNAFSYTSPSSIYLPEPLKERFLNGFFYNRSSDVQYVLKPQYTDGTGKGTDHGTWATYDAHIPLLFFGKGIKQGKTNRETYMTDIAPTIAAMLRIQMPSGSVGKVLEEVVK